MNKQRGLTVGHSNFISQQRSVGRLAERRDGRATGILQYIISTSRPGGAQPANSLTSRRIVPEPKLEQQFVELANSTAGQVYVQWSAQNIDRTVTLYRAARRNGRELVIDLYAADVLTRVAEGTGVPHPGAGFDLLRVLILPGSKRLFARAGRTEVANTMAGQPLQFQGEGSWAVLPS